MPPYNPWYGSIDIDLVSNNRTKHSLMRILVKERDYDHFRIGTHTVYKPTDHGPIIIDFILTDVIALIDPVHGGTELDFNFLLERRLLRYP